MGRTVKRTQHRHSEKKPRDRIASKVDRKALRDSIKECQEKCSSLRNTNGPCSIGPERYDKIQAVVDSCGCISYNLDDNGVCRNCSKPYGRLHELKPGWY